MCHLDLVAYQSRRSRCPARQGYSWIRPQIEEPVSHGAGPGPAHSGLPRTVDGGAREMTTPDSGVSDTSIGTSASARMKGSPGSRRSARTSPRCLLWFRGTEFQCFNRITGSTRAHGIGRPVPSTTRPHDDACLRGLPRGNEDGAHDYCRVDAAGSQHGFVSTHVWHFRKKRCRVVQRQSFIATAASSTTASAYAP